MATESTQSTQSTQSTSTPVLEVEGLSVRFQTPEGEVQAVNDLSFALKPRRGPRHRRRVRERQDASLPRPHGPACQEREGHGHRFL